MIFFPLWKTKDFESFSSNVKSIMSKTFNLLNIMTKDGTNVSAYSIGYLIGSVNNYHLNCACPSYKVIILLQKM